MPNTSLKKLPITCAILVALSAIAAQAVLVDFDDVLGGGTQPILGDRYLAKGVLLSTDGAAGLFVSGPFAYTNTPPNYCIASSTGGSADSKIIVDFVVPNTTSPAATNIVFFYLSDGDTGVGSEWSAAIYDVNGALLDSITGTTNDEVMVGWSRPVKDIRRMVFTPSRDLEGIDSLSFCETELVPEPASLSVLAIGAAALWFRRRR